jgi:hypothetical protein
MVGLVPLCGCYTARQFPLQPGEKIIFESETRAAEFRARSGNGGWDATNRVVRITRPTWVSCE